MPVGSIAAFFGVALLLIVVPGADWAFTLGAGLRGESVAPAVAGLVLGYAGMTVVVAAGVGALVAENPAALTALTVLGGGYLVWQGARAAASPSGPVVTPVESRARAKTGWATLARGAGVSGLNPKGLLIFVALLPQFTSPDRDWPMPVQMGVLGLVFMVTCAVFYFALGSVTRTILISRPVTARAVGRLSGAGMVIVGVLLVVERIGG
ncbi:Threonine/homoserine/homoserine lactone efflux protein [Microbispora rosea]|uniref:Threonine/homoserine/homoserine lactone efflux protein n=1 Tax=Microbispora rosea TaxID=58117 RepID=A0A1N7GYZ3_9ACTN|nr:LysE family translocator [Microbispora rosea]GIH47845.1 lysine transporter LysE [Microbispora rosea subsp. rosea]SIS17781.1 Threonine/homoserine/homoserine lactone efflux protein [Microbispora rosea]